MTHHFEKQPGTNGEVDAAEQPPPPETSSIRRVFVGPSGPRAGWRLLIFVVIFRLIAKTLAFALRSIPALHAWRAAQDANLMTAPDQIYRGAAGFVAVLLTLLLLSRIEKRSFADYYLGSEALGKRFWQGVAYGFALISLLLATIALFHGFKLGGTVLSASSALRNGLLYAAAFLLIGLLEEFLFRGYLQSTLSGGIGFWPAAIIVSVLFGALHLQNAGEAWFGGFIAGSLGLLCAFAVRRTGNVWFPVGMHAAWDWGQAYFYSTPESGFLAQGHLLNSSFHGPSWLTGGGVGPEGSVFALAVLAIGAIGVHSLFRNDGFAPGVRGGS